MTATGQDEVVTVQLGGEPPGLEGEPHVVEPRRVEGGERIGDHRQHEDDRRNLDDGHEQRHERDQSRARDAGHEEADAERGERRGQHGRATAA